MTPILRHQLDNGLWLVAEPMASVQSLAMSLLLPAGVAQEPADRQGAAAMLAEMICRGAGALDSRAHTQALDALGVQRGTGVEVHHLRIGATMLSRQWPKALPLLLDMALRPQLSPAALEPSRDLALQSLAALEDEPQHKAMLELRRRHYPQPFGRSSLGLREHLSALTLDQVRDYQQQCFVPAGAVMGVAGQFDPGALLHAVEDLTANWKGTRAAPVEQGAAPRGYEHQTAATTQVHIGLAYDAPPQVDPDSILQRTAVAVLSGGMSGRLFTEVREKRGLCYAVFARYGGDRERGSVFGYAGTTAARAQETLEVMTGELRRLSVGVERAEFERAVVGMKADVVMQGESTSARAASIAADQFVRGHPRTLDELAAEVEAVTLDRLQDFLGKHPPGPMTVVTVGPNALKLS
jgi:predicted Zn-dependent peptidase